MPKLPNVDGFIPEPDNPKHWSFEEKLKPLMAAGPQEDSDLRPFTSPRHNQKNSGSCVAQSVIKALEIKRIMEHGHDAHVDLSVLSVYYLARELMNPPRTNQDKGTHISLGCDVLRRFGVCTDADWPFDLRRKNMPPSWGAMRKAFTHKIKAFYRITSTGQARCDEVIRCLQNGNPVIYGTAVGDQWFQYRKASDKLLVCSPEDTKGRHATTLVGFKDGLFIGENSWGTRWGDDGFYYMDPSVIASGRSTDFWTIECGWESYSG